MSCSLPAGNRYVIFIPSALLILYCQGQWYRSASRQVRRLQAVIPGPINAHYGETVAGAAVIRAFGAQSVFVNGKPVLMYCSSYYAELLQMLNMKINANAWSWYIGRWLASQAIVFFN